MSAETSQQETRPPENKPTEESIETSVEVSKSTVPKWTLIAVALTFLLLIGHILVDK